MPEWQQVLLAIFGAIWIVVFVLSIVAAADSDDVKIVVCGLFAPFFIPHLIVLFVKFWGRTLWEAFKGE